MKTRIGDIKPNPFRHMERYPIRRDKVAALRESLQTTGFWDNVVARLNENGEAEIAYGHHRLTALREEYSPRHQVSLIIRDLSDEDMLRIMARENMEEWGTSAAVEHETVRAVIEAYGDGLIDLAAPAVTARATELRYAPGFRMGDVPRADGAHAYTAQTVADFLGWVRTSGRPQDKVSVALGALELIEDGVLSEDDFAGMGTKQAEQIVRQAQAARREHEADAKAQAKRAEDARKQAEKAEQDQRRAEEERSKREAQAARAKRDEDRQRAQAQADEADRRARAAEQTQREAERRRKEAEGKAAKEREKGRKEASKVGRGVGDAMRTGKRGYREAADEAARHRTKTKNGGPPDIDKFIGRLNVQVVKILEPGATMAIALEEVIKHQAAATDFKITELTDALGTVQARIEDYRARLGAHDTTAVEYAGELGAGR